MVSSRRPTAVIASAAACGKVQVTARLLTGRQLPEKGVRRNLYTLYIRQSVGYCDLIHRPFLIFFLSTSINNLFGPDQMLYYTRFDLCFLTDVRGRAYTIREYFAKFVRVSELCTYLL